MGGEGGIFPRALTHRIRFAARLILEGDRLRRYLTRCRSVMIMEIYYGASWWLSV